MRDRQIGSEKVRHMKRRMTDQDEVKRNRKQSQIKGGGDSQLTYIFYHITFSSHWMFTESSGRFSFVSSPEKTKRHNFVSHCPAWFPCWSWVEWQFSLFACSRKKTTDENIKRVLQRLGHRGGQEQPEVCVDILTAGRQQLSIMTLLTCEFIKLAWVNQMSHPTVYWSLVLSQMSLVRFAFPAWCRSKSVKYLIRQLLKSTV